MRYKITEPHEFLEQLPFSVKADFHINGRVNSHSFHIRQREKPQEVWQHERDSPKLNFWRARTKLSIIVICFLTKRVNCECYRAMLQDFFIPELWQLNLLDTNFFQQDSAPCHYVRRLFNDVFTDKWIARGGPIAWPALSPNLTLLNYQYTILLLAKMSKYQLLHRSLSYLVYLPTALPNLQASLPFLTFAACPSPIHNFQKVHYQLVFHSSLAKRTC
jgi:hypothetical protein